MQARESKGVSAAPGTTNTSVWGPWCGFGHIWQVREATGRKAPTTLTDGHPAGLQHRYLRCGIALCRAACVQVQLGIDGHQQTAAALLVAAPPAVSEDRAVVSAKAQDRHFPPKISLSCLPVDHNLFFSSLPPQAALSTTTNLRLIHAEVHRDFRPPIQKIHKKIRKEPKNSFRRVARPEALLPPKSSDHVR